MSWGSIEIPPPDCSESVGQPYVGNVSIDHKVPATLILIYIELQSNGTLNKETAKLERRETHLPDLVSIEQRRAVHSHWSRSGELGILVLIRHLSYAIKTQLKAPKAP